MKTSPLPALFNFSEYCSVSRDIMLWISFCKFHYFQNNFTFKIKNYGISLFIIFMENKLWLNTSILEWSWSKGPIASVELDSVKTRPNAFINQKQKCCWKFSIIFKSTIYTTGTHRNMTILCLNCHLLMALADSLLSFLICTFASFIPVSK